MFSAVHFCVSNSVIASRSCHEFRRQVVTLHMSEYLSHRARQEISETQYSEPDGVDASGRSRLLGRAVQLLVAREREIE
jgi:hypothetical protein